MIGGGCVSSGHRAHTAPATGGDRGHASNTPPPPYLVLHPPPPGLIQHQHHNLSFQVTSSDKDVTLLEILVLIEGVNASNP